MSFSIKTIFPSISLRYKVHWRKHLTLTFCHRPNWSVAISILLKKMEHCDGCSSSISQNSAPNIIHALACRVSLIPTLGTRLQSRKFYLTWIDLVWWQSKKLIKTCYQQLCNNTFKQNLAKVGGSGGKKVCLIWSFIKFNYQGSWYLR